MNISYFEKHLPYCIEVNESLITVRNRQYELLAEGIIPIGVDIRESFKSVASPCEDCYREIDNGFKCYLYDAKDNPFVSDKVFDDSLMAEYMKRFSLLHKLYSNCCMNTKHTKHQ